MTLLVAGNADLCVRIDEVIGRTVHIAVLASLRLDTLQADLLVGAETRALLAEHVTLATDGFASQWP